MLYLNFKRKYGIKISIKRKKKSQKTSNPSKKVQRKNRDKKSFHELIAKRVLDVKREETVSIIEKNNEIKLFIFKHKNYLIYICI